MHRSDYTRVPQASSHVIFGSGSTNNVMKCLEIPILEDNAFEGNQTFNVTLTTSDPVIIDNTMITITITDNDC